MLNSNISPTCPYNIVNFGLLAAEIVLHGSGSGKILWDSRRTPAGSGSFFIKSRGNSSSSSAICGSPSGAGYISTGFPPASTISPSMPLSLGINPGQ